MKKYIILLGLVLLMGVTTMAQWTKVGTTIYPTAIGDWVGVGTVPGTNLHVKTLSATLPSDIWATKSVPGNGQVARMRLINDATGSLFNLERQSLIKARFFAGLKKYLIDLRWQ